MIKLESLKEMMKKYQVVLLMALLGIVMLLLPGEKRIEEEQPAQEESAFSVEQIEQGLSHMLSSVEGVGRAEVMLTVKSDGLKIYQENKDLSRRGGGEHPQSYDSNRETVLIAGDHGERKALQVQQQSPQFMGALVVCDGGEQAGTVLKVKEAVSVLTGLGSENISVKKRVNFN